MFLKNPNLIFQELYVNKILSSSHSVDSANNKEYFTQFVNKSVSFLN